MDELQAYLDSISDHNEVLHNHADVLEDHEVRLAQLEQVINTPQPEPGLVAAAEAKVDEPELDGQGEKADYGEPETPKAPEED